MHHAGPLRGRINVGAEDKSLCSYFALEADDPLRLLVFVLMYLFRLLTSFALFLNLR
jgi:hypothetical protein